MSMNSVVRLLSLTMQIGLNGRHRAVPFMLQGPPGVGKTYGIYAIAEQIAAVRKEAFPAEIRSGPQLAAEDASGLPVPDLESGTTRLLPMSLGVETLAAGRGVLCIDEFGSLTSAQEAAFLNLIHGGILGERKLPECIARGAMMNPEDMASNGRALSPPAANRFFWIPEWTINVGDWCDFMRGGRGFAGHVEMLPDDWDKQLPWARGLLASYVSRNPDTLLRMPPPHKANEAWASPRSWENAATLLAACRAVGDRVTSELSAAAIEGCVGVGTAEEFITFLVNANLPDPEDLLANPEDAEKLLPTRNDHLGITVEAVANAAGIEVTDKNGKPDKKAQIARWETACEIIGPVFLAKNDVALMAAKQIAVNMPNGAEYPDWCYNIQDILKQSGLGG